MAKRRLLPMVVVASIVSILLVACGGGATPAPATAQPASPPPPPPAAAPAAPAAPSSSVPSGSAGGAQFEVTLEDPAGSGAYKFGPADMTFSVGETVTFAFSSESEFHTFTVDDLGIDESVDGGTTTTLTFTFDKAGTFDLICVPHEALGMVGTITVQ